MEIWVIAVICGIIIASLLIFAFDVYLDYSTGYYRGYSKGVLDGYDFKIIASKLVIKNVIFNPPATIVFWNDGTKTVVKAENEVFDWEKGLAMAICKKFLSDGKGRYYDIFRKYEEVGVKAAYKSGDGVF